MSLFRMHRATPPRAYAPATVAAAEAPGAGSAVGAWRRRAIAPAAAALAPDASDAAAWRPDAMRLALAALITFSVGRMQEHWIFLMPLRPALLTVVVATACVLLQPGATARNGALRTWPSRVVMALAIHSVLSIFFGLSMGQAGSYFLTSYSKVIGGWLLIVIGIRVVRDYSLLVWSYIAAVAFQIYMAIFVLKTHECYGCAAARLDDGNAYMYDANDMGVLMIPAIPLLLLQFERSGRLGRLVCVVLILGIGWSTALAGSRGAMLGLIATLGALLFLARQVSVGKRLLTVFVVLGGVTLAAPKGYWDQMAKILEPKADYNWDAEDGRMEIWKRGLGYVAEYPVFGVGISNFGRAEGTISAKARYHTPGTGLLLAAPHNTFVQAAAETGIPGFLLWSSLTVGGCLGMLRLRRRLPRHWEHGTADERYLYVAPMYLAVTFIGFAVTSFFLSFAWLSPIYFLAAFCAATYALTAEHMRRTGAAAPSPTAPSRSALPAAARSQRGWRG